ncbi:uncharacterized protein EDB91DRAFT_1139489 [Suillus paluster]|uniref:uncharacterized protein n=1 Tax=Suillus paluster TaxID=48578 RepID=UPI001B875D8C|nr:uncharacterized protein EDB91DRAFT_1139489 [Suillus paluster]KAG1737857.1 hypothetical protein EDB91DRAFT_1139489 [Suillus paluster]
MTADTHTRGPQCDIWNVTAAWLRGHLDGRRPGHEAEMNMLLPHGKALQDVVNVHYLATNTTMNSSTYGFLPSKGFTVPIALVSASVPFLMCFLRRPRALFIWLKSLRFFRDIETEERLLDLKKKWEDEERKRITLEDKLKKLELEQQVSAQEKSTLKTEIVRLTAALKKTSKEADEIQVRLRQEQVEREKVQQERSKLQDAHQKLQQDLSSYQQQLMMRETEKKALRNELQALQAKFNDQTTLLSDRTRELTGKADVLSGAEVIRLVDELNQEIMQTAAFISDSFDFARKPEHRDEIKEASARTSELIGPAMTSLLGTVQHGEDPLLIQIALQAATVEFSRWIIMTWDFDGLQAEQPLAEIYNDVRETESQAVSGRWRALTRSHAQKVALQESDVHSTMVAHISDTLVVVMIAAGCTKNYEDAYREFTMKFGERVSNIVRMAARLNRAMGEEVTSADLWPTHSAAGEKFDTETMKDFDEGSGAQSGVVLCTTALGLQSAEYKAVTLAKPKVALEAIADGMEREAELSGD